MGQFWGQHLNIEKHRVFVNKPFSLLFDSRRHFFKELSVCFVPKAAIRSNAAMQVLRLVGFLFLRYM
jgi:hypothetical protein